jgi:hypothetical protein
MIEPVLPATLVVDDHHSRLGGNYVDPTSETVEEIEAACRQYLRWIGNEMAILTHYLDEVTPKLAYVRPVPLQVVRAILVTNAYRHSTLNCFPEVD